MEKISLIGLLLFPSIFSFMIIRHFIISSKTNFLPLYILSAISAVLVILLDQYAVIILFTLYLFLYIFIIFILFQNKLKISIKAFQAVILINILYTFLALYTSEVFHFVISTGGMTSISLILLMSDYKKKINTFIRQLNNSNKLNKKINHQLTRLQQRNEQYKRIIAEKDIEIFQVSRHASLAEVTTGIAHELAQPLTGIKGLAQNLVDDINYEEFEELQAVSDLLKICSLVDKSTSIIDHIRNFSQKSGFSMKDINLNGSIINAIDLIKQQLKKNNINLISVLDENAPKIYGDNLSLEQLIVNLTLNSQDAILEKRNEDPKYNGNIKITTTAKNNSVKMIIEDNGVGIPQNIISNIWSPFFTTKTRNQGTGIGLSICNKIIKEHNAHIDVKTGSSGTAFIITFPE
ncbi:MAG: hypothetical protein GY754_14115 [bacterium]|nr:hypothetical protein [bacterium]